MGIVTIERSEVGTAGNQAGWHLYLTYRPSADAPIETWRVIRATRAESSESPTDYLFDIQLGNLQDTVDQYTLGTTSESRGAKVLADGAYGDLLWYLAERAAEKMPDMTHFYKPWTNFVEGESAIQYPYVFN